MIKKITTFLLLFILVQINLDLNDDQSLIKAASPSTIQSPIIKWQYGGCYSSWCETGWYSSPAVIDLEGDGIQNI